MIGSPEIAPAAEQAGLEPFPWTTGMNTIDFARSFLTFRIDTLKKPPQTVSHPPPYTLNSARIQLDCVCDIRDRRTEQVTQIGRAHV